jgi:sulfoxide reductase heme-binding subunit YedZ
MGHALMLQTGEPENKALPGMKRERQRRAQRERFADRRMITHLLLGTLTLGLLLLTPLFVLRGKQIEFLIIALGYLSLLLICATLVIGPLNLLRVRRNPVNLDLRRDLGIWAAITGGWHVLLVLRGTFPTDQILSYFVRPGCCGYIPLLNIFGISNDLGLFATLLLLLLLALSNTVSLRMLKGKWWKRLQRLTYPLALLAVAHTIGYQLLNVRGPIWLTLVLLLSALVLICQGFGVVLSLTRHPRKSQSDGSESI